MLTNAEYLEVDPIGVMNLRNVYIYYDEPILFSFRTNSYGLYVGNLIKETVNYQRWLYIRVWLEDLLEFEVGDISLLECLKGSKYTDCYVSEDFVGGKTKYYKVDKGLISDKDLPSEDYYIRNN